ncbi:MAG: VapE domain-containing protein [Cellvibrionaceae bacterium]
MAENNKKGPSDFNDLHLEKGLQEVKRQLMEAVDKYRSRALETSDFSEAPPAPPLDSYNEFVDVRQPSLGDESDSSSEGRLDIHKVLSRYCYLMPSGEVWDSAQEKRVKKTAFKDFIGPELFKEWLSHEGRKNKDDALVNSILNSKRESQKIGWESRLQLTDSGSVKADIANAKLVLDNDDRWQGVLAYCDFSYRLMKRKAPPFSNSDAGEWTDSDTDRLRIWLSENYAFTPKSADALGAVVVAAEGNRFHPVREYLEGLEWDGEKRVATWLHKYLGSESNDYHDLVGSMWLISAIARVMQPPVKVDSVIIFEGLQGLGKSTALSILGGEWFTDTPLVLGDKDGFQQMQGVWIIELAELDSFNKAESTRAKQFFGSKTDRYRPSYGRIVQTFSRQCVFAGSTNQESYLKDATGNRRYWPAMCTKIDAEALRKDRDQLWAEAFTLYKAGAKWWPQDEHKSLFEAQQENRFDSDVWEEIIEDWLRSHSKPVALMNELMGEALKLEPGQMRPPEQKRVGQIMSHLGWPKTRPRVNGKRENGYKRPDGWDVAVPISAEADTLESF